MDETKPQPPDDVPSGTWIALSHGRQAVACAHFSGDPVVTVLYPSGRRVRVRVTHRHDRTFPDALRAARLQLADLIAKWGRA